MKINYHLVIYTLVIFIVCYAGYRTIDFILKKYTLHNDIISVPHLVGFSMDADTLSTFNLEFIVRDSAAYNPNYERGAILSHAPKSGSIVKPGRKIFLTINPYTVHYIAFPDLKNKSLRQAINLLENNAFRIGTLYYVDHFARDVIRYVKINPDYHNLTSPSSIATLNKNSVINVSDSLPKFSVVDLYLGNGHVEYISPPNLIGFECDSVLIKRKLNNNSLNLGECFCDDSVEDTLKSIIYQQVPNLYDNIPIGSFVSVWAKDTIINQSK